MNENIIKISNSKKIYAKLDLEENQGIKKIKGFKKVAFSEIKMPSNFIDLFKKSDVISYAKRINATNEKKDTLFFETISKDPTGLITNDVYVSFTNDAWGKFCYLMKESCEFVFDGIFRLEPEKIVSNNLLACIILYNGTLESQKREIKENYIPEFEIIDGNPIFPDNAVYMQKHNQIYFSNPELNGSVFNFNDSFTNLQEVEKCTVEVLENTRWLEPEEQTTYEFKGVLNKTNCSIDLLFYLPDPTELGGYGFFELFRVKDFEKMESKVQLSLIREGIEDMIWCLNESEIDDEIYHFDLRKSCTTSKVIKYSDYIEGEKTLDLNKEGKIGLISKELQNNSLYVVTIVAFNSKVKGFKRSKIFK